MKVGESRPDHGDESLRFGPDETVLGWKTPQWSAGRRRACNGTRHLLRGARLWSSAISALRSLTRWGKGN